MTKKEQNKPSLQDEITSLKHQLAGSKGRNKQLVEENKAMKDKILGYTKEIERINDAVKTAHDLAANYKSELFETKIKLTDYKAIVEWYNELPWWKKVFVKRIEIY